MPLDLGDDPTRLCPASGLIGEVRVATPRVAGWSPDRAREQVPDPFLQDAVGGKPNRILDPLAFEIPVDIRTGEARVGAEIDARHLAAIARQDRLQNAFPAVGAVNVAGTQGAALQIAKLVEHEQRMVAGALVMPIPDAHLLFAVRRADARIHVEHYTSGRTTSVNAVDPLAREIGERVVRPFPLSANASNRPIWLADAAHPKAALPPTIQRIAGSLRSRSASLTSLSRRAARTPPAATYRPERAGRSCRCARPRASRQPSPKGRAHRQARDRQATQHRR